MMAAIHREIAEHQSEYESELSESQRVEEEFRAALRNLEQSIRWSQDEIHDAQKHMKRADEIIASRKRRLRLIGIGITVVGVGAGLLLILWGSRLEGFWKELLIALGTGALTTGTIGIVAALVGPMLNPADKDKDTRILSSLNILINTTSTILVGLRQAEVEYRGYLKVDSEDDPRSKLSWFP